MNILRNGASQPIESRRPRGPAPGPNLKARDLVIVCDASPLEADEIRRVFRHVDKLGDFYFHPEAQSIKEIATDQDFFGELPPAGWAANPTEEFFTSVRYNYDTTWLVNPSQDLVKDLRSYGKAANKVVVINGNSDAHPAAILQLCAEFGVYPERRQQLVGYFAKHYVSPPEKIESHLNATRSFPETLPTRAELDWLLSRNYRLQGVDATRENFARETWAERSQYVNWARDGGCNANLITIETPYTDCTPFYDLIYRDHCDGLFRNCRGGTPLVLITTPVVRYLINKVNSNYLFDELHKDVEARGLELPPIRSSRLPYGVVSTTSLVFPGGLKCHARIYRPMVYETYSHDLDPAVIIESSIFD